MLFLSNGCNFHGRHAASALEVIRFHVHETEVQRSREVMLAGNQPGITFESIAHAIVLAV